MPAALVKWVKWVRKMDKIVENGILYDFYGSLLTPHQQKIYEDAVYHDLSLNEIAQEHKISKQAVSDLLRRATQQMQEYEQKLSLIARFRRIRSVCDGIEKAARDGSVTPEEVVCAVSVIKKEL